MRANVLPPLVAGNEQSCYHTEYSAGDVVREDVDVRIAGGVSKGLGRAEPR